MDDNVTYLYDAYSSPGVPAPGAERFPSAGTSTAPTEPDPSQPESPGASCSCQSPYPPVVKYGAAFLAGVAAGLMLR